MKSRVAALMVLLVAPAFALDGEPGMHDPSTVIQADGKFYVYATGNGLPAFVSDDGWTWRRAGSVMQAVPGGRPGPDVIARGGNNSWAPDVIRVGDRYFLYYSAPGTQPKSAIGLLVGKTLDPNSPDYKWEDGGPVVWSDGVEDSNAIDPGVLRDPTNGTLWLTYGSYFGYIRLVELDPKTGKRLHPERKPVNIAINSEASIMIFRDGWYYLLVTHGSCCAGGELQLQHPHGPVEKSDGAVSRQHGHRHAAGRREAVCSDPSGRHVGAGTFRPARSRRRRAEVLLPLRSPTSIAAASACSTSVLCSGATAGRSRAITSRRAPTQSNPRGRARRSKWPCRACRSAAPRPRRSRRSPVLREAAANRASPPPATPIAAQDVAQVVANWPSGPVDVRMAPYMVQAQQKWTITPVADAGGYPGSPFFKITIAGTDRALAATAESELVVLPAFSGAPGTTVAHRSAHRRHISRDAEGGAEFDRTVGALGCRQQHADACKVQA